MRVQSLLVSAAVLFSTHAFGAARFTGGLCVSQGSWLQAALQQTDVISNAINALRNDESCQALIKALEKSPKVDGSKGDDEETMSFANTYQELSALSDYMKPDRRTGDLKATHPTAAMSNEQFQKIVFNLVFNKSYESIREIHSNADYSQLSNSQRQSIQDVSVKLKAFLKKSKDVANMAMSTSRGILAALPESKMCLHNKPSQTAVIFGAIAQSAAALTTGGQINGVGEFVASLLQYSREMSYINALQPLEMERFQASVSCLLESTAESYCTIQDAEDTLNYFKDLNLSEHQKKHLEEVIKNTDRDPVANPLGGLVILMRDVPVLSGWMQRVLFGIDPKISSEAEMKNKYWASYLGFIQTLNSLQADFRDQESLYYSNTNGKDNLAKLGQVKKILESVMGNLGTRSRGTDINFFERVFQSTDSIPFTLLGLQIPPNFNTKTYEFDQFWLDWSKSGDNGFNDPDALLAKMKTQVWLVMEKAQKETNAFFASRMVVDPQNLLTEAMKGPGVSAFQALVNLRNYYLNLIEKLEKSIATLENDRMQETRRDQLVAHVALLKDSAEKADKIIKSLRAMGSIRSGQEMSTQMQSQRAMDLVYEAANMMVSRDSFFSTRMMTAVQVDLSDTLWRKEKLNDRQTDFFLSVGPEIVSRLSGFFTTDPVAQRADVSQAKMIHLANLKSTEDLFAKVVFNQILNIDCKIYGGAACEGAKGLQIDPTKDNERIRMLNQGIVRTRDDYQGWRGVLYMLQRSMNKPTEDSVAHHQVRAKLCIQALAFESRNQFKEICRDAKLVSDFADQSDTFGLNLDFNQQLAKINAVSVQNASDKKIDNTRNLGVCSLRSYLRKNHIFYMYREHQTRQ